ncbi:unnamed protein product [Thlaspi arvense]|uniref:Uncharacterized protein n=1 Tax=Thlaspi arvense TaxID=13288 RepID=A0AAU9SYM8_THLAR|nr:unnamed protein product [Thlaspi arvense]
MATKPGENYLWPEEIRFVIIIFSCTTVAGFSMAEEGSMASLTDDINAYSYFYPTELPSKKLVFKWLPRIHGDKGWSPESQSDIHLLHHFLNAWIILYDSYGELTRYCSQHDTADARLRIVSERVDIIDNLVISVSIGPPNTVFLKSKDKSTWTAKDVADSVLSDKSALTFKDLSVKQSLNWGYLVVFPPHADPKISLRITSSQRMAESSVLDAHSSEIDGEPYWYYEYLVRKSPTKSAQEPNIYRHYVSSTAERDELSSESLHCRDEAIGGPGLWSELQLVPELLK